MATVTITTVDLQSGTDKTVYAKWTWSKEHTKEFSVQWWYYTGDGTWFWGTTNTVKPGLRHDTYSAPSNATAVKVKIKPISTTYKKNGKDTNYWTADWSSYKTYYFKNNPPSVPPVPTVTIDGLKLTASVENLDMPSGTTIEFQVLKNDGTLIVSSGKSSISYGRAAYTCNTSAGATYRARCRAIKGSDKSEWSEWSGNNDTRPYKVTSFTTCRASSATSVYLEWGASTGAETYEVQYATKKEYLESSDQSQSVTGITTTHYEKTGLESGNEYFFRVRGVSNSGESLWSEIRSVILGKEPDAPTTWSSTTTVIVGEPLILYWVHNTEDGSSQVKAELELTVNGTTTTHTITNSTDEDEKDKTSSYEIDTSAYSEGAEIKWRVRTCGITGAYGDWSVLRTVDVYAQPTLELTVTKNDGTSIIVLDSFPFYVNGIAGPESQTPIGYHLTITSDEVYETIDQIGNKKTINKGEELYSKYFDISTDLVVEMSASNLDLENNISYTVNCTVTMNSGLNAEATYQFSVAWTDELYEPEISIGIDPDTYAAYITPACKTYPPVYYKVTKVRKSYVKSEEVIEAVEGTLVEDAYTLTDEPVYSYTDDYGNTAYYTVLDSEVGTFIEGVTLSVYRREYDGSFVELMTGIPNDGATSITDPHPALDYARYRVVATAVDTGAVSYYDPPGYPVNGIAAILQWDEQWSNFQTSELGDVDQPPWAGSLLKLPYNIDVSDSHDVDVALVEYIGREHPVSYYGTQLGVTSTWNMDVPKYDKDTLYALRRLSRWTGDVYVREPSGSGYWASVKVSFSQKHCELVIPVSLSITRVEGGI